MNPTADYVWAGRRLIAPTCIHNQPLSDPCGTCEHEAFISHGTPEEDDAVEANNIWRAAQQLSREGFQRWWGRPHIDRLEPR